MSGPRANDRNEVNELVSHVLSLRKDYVQDLLRRAKIPFSGMTKPQLREQIAHAIVEETLSVQTVVEYLDATEPGGKQHVFMFRPTRAINDHWRDTDARRAALLADPATQSLMDAPLPLLMPGELQLSSIRLDANAVEITGVESRGYIERDKSYDREDATELGLKVELRAYVHQISRSVVTLRWDLDRRRAALHITQASQRGIEPNYYRNVANRFGEAVTPWLDFNQFDDENLRRVLHELHTREENGAPLTRSRRGKWETDDGAEMEVVSSSIGSSVFADPRITAAVGQVANNHTGRAGSLFWLARPGTPLDDDLHVAIVASDSRIHFLRPSAPEAVNHVIEQVRELL